MEEQNNPPQNETETIPPDATTLPVGSIDEIYLPAKTESQGSDTPQPGNNDTQQPEGDNSNPPPQQGKDNTIVQQPGNKKANHSKKANPVTDAKAKRTRFTLTGNYTTEEFEAIKKVVDDRISNGQSDTTDHFVRQCIDFALHHGCYLTNYLKNLPAGNVGLFALPDNYQPQPLKRKGFFNN